MSYAIRPGRGLRAILMTLVMMLVLTTGAFAGGNGGGGGGGSQSNNVSINIEGGDATALALCLNAVKDGNKVYQQNKCKNTAIAVGGNVVLKNVSIVVIQENS